MGEDPRKVSGSLRFDKYAGSSSIHWMDPQLVRTESKISLLSQLCVSCFTEGGMLRIRNILRVLMCPPFTKHSYDTLPNRKVLFYRVVQYPNHDIYDFDIKSEDLKSWKRYQYGS